jgi:hypothetical protein
MGCRRDRDPQESSSVEGWITSNIDFVASSTRAPMKSCSGARGVANSSSGYHDVALRRCEGQRKAAYPCGMGLRSGESQDGDSHAL